MLETAKKGKRKKKQFMRDIEAGFDYVLQGNLQEALKSFDNAIKGGYRTAQNFPDQLEMFDEKYPAEEPQKSKIFYGSDSDESDQINPKKYGIAHSDPP